LSQASAENGTKRVISTSKIKNSTAIRKNWKENGFTMSIFGFRPHSNEDSSGIFCSHLVNRVAKTKNKIEINREVLKIEIIFINHCLI